MTGSDERRAVLVALVRAALRDDARAAPHLAEARRLALDLGSAPDIAQERLDGLWTLAVRTAEAPGEQGEETRVSLTLPTRCPLDPATLTPGLDVVEAVARIRGSAGTG